MINGKDTLFIIALVYVVVFIVLTVCFKNNKENFAQAPTISLQRAIEGKRENMIQQMGKQQDQNKRISDFKKVISNLRTDLTIIKKKENDENASIYHKVTGQDSLSEVSNTNGGSYRSVNGKNGDNSKGSKKYNLNLNLHTE